MFKHNSSPITRQYAITRMHKQTNLYILAALNQREKERD